MKRKIKNEKLTTMASAPCFFGGLYIVTEAPKNEFVNSCSVPIIGGVSKKTQAKAPALPFDEIMRRAMLVTPDKPKKASRPKQKKAK